MSFRIGYKKYLTLRCWHDFFLGPDLAEADMPLTVTPAGDKLMAYLNYDTRNFLALEPVAESRALLQRLGLSWRASTQGGWLLAKTTVNVPTGARLMLALAPRGADFSARTELGARSVGRIAHLTTASVSSGAGTQVQGWGKDWLTTTERLGYARGGVNLSVNNPAPPIELATPDGATVLKNYTEVVVTADGAERVLPLDDIPPGEYQFRGAGVTTTKYLLNYSIPPHAVAVLDLDLSQVEDITYDLRFTARQPATFKL